MKNTVLKSVLAIVMAFMALPMVGQDYLTIVFKDGKRERHLLSLVTELRASKYDNDGVLHSDYVSQQLIMQDTVYNYALEKIDSISFKCVDEEHIAQNINSALLKIEYYLSACESVNEIKNYLWDLENDAGVEKVDVYENAIVVRIKDWRNIIIHEIPLKEMENHVKKNQTIVPYYNTNIKRKAPLINQSVKVAIADQNAKNEAEGYVKSTNTLLRTKGYYDEMGFDVKYIPQPSLDFFHNDIFNYHVVLLTTHGIFENGQHWFLTGEEIGEATHVTEIGNGESFIGKAILQNYYNNKYDLEDISFYFSPERRGGKKKWILYAACSENYIGKSPYHFEKGNTIIFTNVCESLNGNHSVAEMFYRKGASAYLGYEGTTYLGENAGESFSGWILSGKSTQSAFNSLPDFYIKEANGAILSFLPKANDAQFITRTVTAPSSEVKDEILENGTHLLTLYGYTTILDNENLKKGFLLSRYSDMSNVQDVPVTNPFTNVDSDYGNKRFQISLTLDPGEEVYFRAYTNDELFLNKGEVQNYFIESISPLALSSNTLTLSVNTSGSVDITSGSGSYVVESSDEFVATAFLDGNTISINALNPGDVTITVSDKVSGRTQTIKVTVTGQAATRELMVTKTVNKTVYSLYKKTLDENNYRTNPDGWRCYRSELVLDIIKDGRTESYVIDNNIYLDKKNSHHTGQHPCLLLDYNKNMIGVFCNSKESGSNYDMDGYYYSSSMSNINFSKETVFEGYNWGWFPYFRDYGDDNVNLCNFSYDGNFTILAVRASGSWDLYYDNKDISPDAAQQIWERIGSVLVIGKTQDDEVDDRIHTVIPEEIRDVIDEYIPIYDGMNPPNIEGSYYLSPQILIGSSLSYDQIGKEYSAEYQKYGNQDMEKNTIDMVRVQGGGTEWDKGSGAFISGTGNNFTIYFDMAGESRYTNDSGVEISVPTKMAYIVSGTKTSSGIKNLTVGFVMKEKGYDPDEMIVDVGTFRFFTDQDGMCEATSWPYGNQYGTKKRVKQGNALPNSLDKNREKLTPLK